MFGLSVLTLPMQLIAEFILLAILMLKVKPVHRRAAVIGAAGMGLSIGIQLLSVTAELGGLFTVIGMPMSGVGGGSNWAVAGAMVMTLASVLQPIGRGLGLFGLAACLVILVERIPPEGDELDQSGWAATEG